MSNVVLRPKVYETFRKAVIAGRLLRVTGRIQRDGQVAHVIAEDITDMSQLLSTLARPADALPEMNSADHTTGGKRLAEGSTARHPREQAKKLFPSRDFH